MTSRGPSFFLVGAARSGTSALFSMMGQHPQIFTPRIKEPHFFALGGRRPAFKGPGDESTINRRAVFDRDDYRRLFAGAQSELVLGEASTSYLYYPQVPARIYEELGTVKIIAVLRDPVHRAFSNFQYMRAQGREPLSSFEAALAAEEERIRAGWEHIWHYRQLGYYNRQLERYVRIFGRASVHVLLHEDLRQDPSLALRQLFTFLGVDPEAFISTDLELNISGRPRSEWLSRLIIRSTPDRRIFRRWIPEPARPRLAALRRALLVRDPIPLSTAGALLEGYRSDLELLAHFLDRDLSHWLDPSVSTTFTDRRGSAKRPAPLGERARETPSAPVRRPGDP